MTRQHWYEGGGDPEEPERLAAGARLPAGPQPPVLAAPAGPQPQPAGGVDLPQRGLLLGQTTLQLSGPHLTECKTLPGGGGGDDALHRPPRVFLKLCHCPVRVFDLKGFTQLTPHLSRARPCTSSDLCLFMSTDTLCFLFFPARGRQTWYHTNIKIYILPTYDSTAPFRHALLSVNVTATKHHVYMLTFLTRSLHFTFQMTQV